MKTLIRFTLTALLALIATTLAHAGDKITYYHIDALGSPVAATNQLGQVIWRETYKPHGQRTTNAAASANNKVWFTGKQEESALGINYFGARWYHPEVGRFLVIDPVRVSPNNIHSFNRYGYANNNPYKYVDPDGRHPAIILGVGVGLGAVFGTNNAQAPTNSGDLHPNMDTKTLEAAGAISALGGLKSLLGRGAANGADDVAGAASRYENVTQPGSKLPNYETNVTKGQFEKNLRDDGFSQTTISTKKGPVDILTKGDKTYSTRNFSKSTDGPTAEVFKNNQPVSKIRLGRNQ